MSEFQELKVGDHISLLSGFPFSSTYFDRAEGTRLIRIRDLLESDGDKTYYRGVFDSRWLVKHGDILIGMDGDFNIVRWKGDDALLNQRILKAEAKTNGLIDQNFFFYWCGPYLLKVHSRTAATTVKHLSVRDIEKAKDLFPSKGEQRKIAEILSTVDAAKEKTEALIAKHQQIKTGLMHDLFTRGVTPDGQLRPTRAEAPQLYKQSPLGWIPNEWDVVTLKSEIGIGHGFAFSGEFFSDSPPGSILLTPGNFHRDGGLYFTKDNTKYFQGVIPPETMLRSGQMVTVMTDLSPQTLILGRFAMVDTPFPVLHNQRVGRVSLKNTADWDWNYLCSALNNESLRRQIILEATGTTVRHTSPERILKKQIARPLRDEQRMTVSIMIAIGEKVSTEAAYLDKLRALKQGLMQDLLTGRVPVRPAESGSGQP
jgi:type I restriction enzyme S subunit